ncbi:ecdysone 20-monooxygenase isoform X2 [Pieris napi]|uniref:ecdysone 20-monooxygenase isoform X2 n=1 Tax=Pieris napi TaxID=78633 RepID=UPI001FBB784D|nr:ecdysone 20-monooxygenase isoform X2 [Pieris napi]
MSLPGSFLFSYYVESFLGSPRPLVDWSGVPTIILVVLALVMAATAMMVRPGDAKRPIRLPGPPALPIIGTRWLFWSRYKLNKLHEAYEDMFRRYGLVFVEITPGGAPIVSIAERGALEAVLRTPSKRPYRPPTEIVQVYRRSRPDRYASTGLVNEQGDKWHHLRRHLTSDLTSPQTMQNFIPQLNNICDDFLILLKNCRRPDGTVLGFDHLTNRMGLESVCGLMLGARLGFLERCMSGRAATLATAVKAHFRAQRDSYYGAPLWKFAPTTLYKSFVKSEDTIHTIVSDLMEEAKSRSRGAAQDDGMQEIFLKILANPELDMRDKKAAVIDFITAGIETTFVLAHTVTACKREENFWRASEYLPERWIDVREPHAASLVAPFGRGKRMCPGKRFVEMELHLLVAKIIQQWRVEFDGELDVQFDFLLSPKSPVSLRLVEW